MQNGSWGQEERQVPYFPFFYNQFFEMFILCDSECYKVLYDCLKVALVLRIE